MSDQGLARLPSYSAEPRHGFEERLALTRRRPCSDFIVGNKPGITLRLPQVEQAGNLPVICSGEPIQGTLEVSKLPRDAACVEVKVCYRGV
jgi:hypothetical protein